MRTEIITSIVDAATTLHNLFERALVPNYDKPYYHSLYEITWGSCTPKSQAAINRLTELKNEYAANMLAAPEPARVKGYYRQQIQKCKELCPYKDCGYFGEYGKSIFVPAIEKLAEYCKGKSGYKQIDDDDEKNEYLCRAERAQHEFVSNINAIAIWWESIEPSRRLYRLSLYPQANTERAQKYFAIAIDKGFMGETSTGYEWLKPEHGTRGNKAALAYFIDKVYTENYTPDKELEALFGYKRLGDAASKSQTPQASIIDCEIFGDEE